MKRIDNIQKGWKEYTLIDTGEGRKLERIGGVLCDRPDPQSLWKKTITQDFWETADIYFKWEEKGKRWNNKNKKEEWTVFYNGVTLSLFLSGAKHIGVFPEHAHQWDEIMEIGKKHKNLKMLNLFGYTGGASIAGALSGMEVTHVDASKTTIETVKKNALLSRLGEKSIRTVCEDALKYVKRLVERGEVFDVIVMDPPAFGRGPKGEVWKIEESLSELLSYISKIVSKDPKLVLLNGYASGYNARSFGEMMGDIFPKEEIVCGDIGIEQEGGKRVLPTGIYAKLKK
jgi:23S rRNA (cytosine1962-C5)-methyltransferase